MTTTKRKAGPRLMAVPPMVELGAMVLDPVLFSTGLLGHDLWSTQAQILRSIEHNPRTAVKACHASSKTFTAADAVVWWTVRHPKGIVVTTAPTWTQVEKLLWGHIHQAVQSGRVGFPPLLKTALNIGPENYAIGLSTNEGVRFQGWHGQILVILDEAPGVLPEIWEAIEGIRAGGDVRVLALGQPVTLSGPFYSAFHGQRANWSTYTISAFDTPNFRGICLDNGKKGEEHVRLGSADPKAPNLLTMSPEDLGRNARPYLITRSWVREKWYEWGETGSPLWDVKVLGQFPVQAEDSLFSLAWIDAARSTKPCDAFEPLVAGIDVAGPGEAETVVSIRQGPNRIALKWWLKPDPRGEVAAFLNEYRDRLREVRVDEIGQGWYFMQHLSDLGFPVRGINVGSTDDVDTERYKDQKAKYYWALRDRAQSGDWGGITDPVEQAQLTSLRYYHTPRGQIAIVPKDKLLEEGVPSPDRAEADMLAYAPDAPAPPPRRTGISSHVSYTG